MNLCFKFLRFFEDLFNEILSEKKMIEYLHDIGVILFDSNDDDESVSIFDFDEERFFKFTQKTINNLMPSK